MVNMNRKNNVIVIISIFAILIFSCVGCANNAEQTYESVSSSVTSTELVITTQESTESEETEATEETSQTTVVQVPDGTIVLPDTNITFTLPEGYTVTDQIPGMEEAHASAQSLSFIKNNAVFTAGYNDDGDYSMCGITIIYLGNYDISTFDSSTYIENGLGKQMSLYDEVGIDYERRTETITLNGFTYQVEILETIPADDEPSVAIANLFIGDEDAVYCTILMSPAENAVQDFLNAFGTI